MQYFQAKGERIECRLCAHLCALKDHQSGICGVNRREGDVIENLVFGHPAALHVDPVEKKPLYHFLPGSHVLSLGTVGCNFHCAFCQNWAISQEHDIDRSHDVSPQEIVLKALQEQSGAIAYTYNEPTIFYPYAKAIAELAKEHGIKNIFVTNGYQSVDVAEDMVGVIDAANVDLKSFNPRYYKKALGGRLETVLENLKRFKRSGIWIEVTTLIVPQRNDGDDELKSIAAFIANELGCDTPWHISAFHPDYKERELPPTPLSTLEKAYEIGKQAGLHYVYLGNVAHTNTTFCSECHAPLIERHYMGVSAYRLEKGRCPQCGKILEGVFHEPTS